MCWSLGTGKLILLGTSGRLLQGCVGTFENHVCCGSYSYERLEFLLTSEQAEYDLLNRNTGNKKKENSPKTGGGAYMLETWQSHRGTTQTEINTVIKVFFSWKKKIQQETEEQEQRRSTDLKTHRGEKKSKVSL